MHGLSLLKNAEFVRASNAIAAGTGTTNGSAIDMSSAESVTFVGCFGTLTSTNVSELKVQESADGSTGWTDIPGATASTNDTMSNKMLAVEAIKPSKRFVRFVLIRSTANAVVDAIVAILNHARKSPVVQGSTVGGSASGVSAS